MKLQELYLVEAVSTTSAINQLISVASSLVSHTAENKTVYAGAASNAENNQTQVLRKAGKKKTKEAKPSSRAASQVSLRNNRWFTDHFKSSKGGLGGLQSALETISRSNLSSSVTSKANNIASIKTSAYNAAGRNKTDSKAGSGTQSYDNLITLLPGLLDAIASTQDGAMSKSLSSKASAIRTAASAYESTVSKTSQGEIDFDNAPKQKAAKQKAKQAGTNQSAATNTAAQLINELVPKDKRSAVKAAVDRSDNKLQTLKAELDKLGIKESVNTFKQFLLM